MSDLSRGLILSWQIAAGKTVAGGPLIRGISH